MLAENQWRQPLYFTYPPSWLLPYARLERLANHILPQDSTISDRSILQENLLIKYSYRGYADLSVPFDQFSRLAGQDLFVAFLSMAQCELMRGDSSACEQAESKLLKLLLPERIQPT